MTRYVLRGIELRSFLVARLMQGPRRAVTIAELVEALDDAGFDVPGRPAKVISDALRWEQDHRRVLRIPDRRGEYVRGTIPRSTGYRILQRARRLEALAVTRAHAQAEASQPS